MVKKIENAADWDETYHYYYDGQKQIELRNSDDETLKVYVWGTEYIDELVQIGINPSTGSGP